MCRKPVYTGPNPQIFYSGITRFDCTSEGSESPKGRDGLFGLMIISALHEYMLLWLITCAIFP